jgi:hypothetical protein
MRLDPQVPAHSIFVPSLVAVVPFMIAVDLAAVHGSVAGALKLPLSLFLPVIPLVVLAIYFIVGLLLRNRAGVFAWVAAFILGTAASFAPVLVVQRYAESLPVSRWLTSEETAELQARLAQPYVHCSGVLGGEICLLVRKADDHEQLIEYLRSIDVYKGVAH